jgi:amino acid adenylation domain-containing protein
VTHATPKICQPDSVIATPLQQGMIFHNLRDRGAGIDIEQISVHCSESIDRDRIDAAFTEMLRENEILRGYFDWESGDQPMLRISRDSSLPITEQTAKNESDLQVMLASHLERERAQGFDLDEAPLMRACLFHSGGTSVLVWTFHHALLDGRSFAPLLEELFLRYQKTDYSAAARPRFTDYAQWLGERDTDHDLDYWRAYLTGVNTPCVFPALSPKKGAATFGFVEDRLSVAETATIEKQCAEFGVSVNTMLQAAWAVLLRQYVGTPEVVFGATYTTRYCDFADATDLIGLMINTLPVRGRLSESTTGADLLGEFSKHAKDVRPHVLAPLNLVQQQANLSGDMQLFDTAVVFDRLDVDAALRQRQPDWRHLQCSYTGQTNFALALVVYGGENLSLRLEFDHERIDDEHGRVILSAFRNSLDQLSTNAGKVASKLSLLSEGERRRKLSPTIVSAKEHECLHDRFRRVADSHPERPALRCGDDVMSYRQLDLESDLLAKMLVGSGVNPQDKVGLCMERNNGLIVGVLGILKSGATYVPIDPAYPDSRIQFTLDDAGVDHIVSDVETRDRLAKFGRTILISSSAAATPETELPDLQDIVVALDDLAYVIYTSGSTGTPKGVAVTHQNVSRLMASTQHWFGFDHKDKWTLFHSIAFDWTVFEIWGALSYGGELNIVPYWVTRSPSDFYQLLSEKDITVLCQTPSAFLSLQDTDNEYHDRFPNCLRFVIFGGEALELSSLAQWISRYGDDNPKLVNMYGITETTVHVTYRRITQADVEASPGSVIGEPIPDLDILLLNEHAEPVPAGVVAEIHVAGDGIAREYLNQPELTQQKFCTDRSEELQGVRLYRSGDLARWLPNGDLVYAGRADFQVKIRGFRIELGEIENVIASIAGVQQVVVIAVTGASGTSRLVAYYVSATVTPAQISSTVTRTLPAHMVPAQVLQLDALPLTQNGKVDRSRLPDPGFSESSSNYRPPQPGNESALAQICEDILGVENMGADDNFFERGGDSILSIQLVSRARKSGISLTARAIYQNPTISAMCRIANDPRVSASVSRGASVEDEIPLLAVQEWFFNAVGPTDHWNQSFSFSVRHATDVDTVRQALATIARRHPILNARFEHAESGWRQFADIDPKVHVEEREASSDADNGANDRQAFVLHINQQVRMAGDQRICAGLLNFKDGRQELCIAVHHLVIDGITWNVIVHELDELLDAERKTTFGKNEEFVDHVFAEWSQYLAANSAQFLNEKSYWDSRVVLPRTADTVSAFTHSASLHVSQKPDTWPFWSSVSRQDVILAAFSGALSSATGHQQVCFDLESHGRSYEVSPLDFSQAAGWFTSIYPFSAELPDHSATLAVLESVHREMRAVPRSGIGYGVLASSGEIDSREQAEHLFNYMGNFSSLFDDCTQLQMRDPMYKVWRSGTASHSHPCEWIIGTDDRGIHVDALFDDTHIDAKTVEAIAREFLHRVEITNTVINEHEIVADKLLVSTSDWDRVKGAAKTATRILPTTPIQELYLYGSRGGNDIGIEQWYLQFDGTLDGSALRLAWEETLRNHSGLCTTFPVSSRGKNLQAFHDRPNLVWEVYSIDRDDEFADVQRREMSLGLNVAQGPMHRLALVAAGDRSHYLVWTHHHTQIDGWSWPIVLREVHGRYRDIVSRQIESTPFPPSDYASYVDWLFGSRPKIDAQFWGDYLENLGDQGCLPQEQTGLTGVSTRSDIVDHNLANELNKVAIKECVTQSSIFHAAWSFALARLLDRCEVSIGSTFSGRPSGDVDFTEVVGPFVTNLPVRVQVGDQSPTDIVAAVHATMLDFQERQFHSPAEIQEASGLPWVTPMYESLLVFQNYSVNDSTFDLGDNVEVSEVFTPVRTNFPVTVVVNPGEDVRLEYIYDSSRISAAFIDDAARLVRRFLDALATRDQVGERRSFEYAKSVRSVERVAPKGDSPANQHEEKLVQIWRSMFGDERIGVTDNFFDLGGRSIMVPVLMAKIELATGTTVPFAILFQDPTVRNLANHLRGESEVGSDLARRGRDRASRSKAALRKAASRRSRKGKNHD